MSLIDRTLKCVNCGSTFTCTAEEQVYYEAKRNVYEQKLCPSCGQAQKAQISSGSRAGRKIYPAVCAKCGNFTLLPFKRGEDVPVYCSSCYSWAAQSRY